MSLKKIRRKYLQLKNVFKLFLNKRLDSVSKVKVAVVNTCNEHAINFVIELE